MKNYEVKYQYLWKNNLFHFNSSMSTLCMAVYEFQNFFRLSNQFDFFMSSSGKRNYQWLIEIQLCTSNNIYPHLINIPLSQVDTVKVTILLMRI